MSDLKISQMTAGGVPQSTDQIMMVRAGTNYSIQLADIATVALKWTKTTLTSSQIVDLMANPVQLTTAPGAGFYSQPFRVIGYRAAGTSYAMNGLTGLKVGHYVGGIKENANAGIFHCECSTSLTPFIFLQSASSWTMAWNGPSYNWTGASQAQSIDGTTSGGYTGIPITSNQSLYVWTSTDNITGGTGSVTLWTYYYNFPLTP